MEHLTAKQLTNFGGFPKAAELIEITGAHALEASDRAIFNQLLQIAHDSGKLTEPDAEWEVTLVSLRRAFSKCPSGNKEREIKGLSEAGSGAEIQIRPASRHSFVTGASRPHQIRLDGRFA